MESIITNENFHEVIGTLKAEAVANSKVLSDVIVYLIRNINTREPLEGDCIVHSYALKLSELRENLNLLFLEDV